MKSTQPRCANHIRRIMRSGMAQPVYAQPEPSSYSQGSHLHSHVYEGFFYFAYGMLGRTDPIPTHDSAPSMQERRANNGQASISLEGYAAVAGWIALDPDNETFVFRKFDRLAARNLLCIQSELLSIEKKLAAFDAQDAQAAQDDLQAKDTARTWETLVSRSRAGDDGSRRRVEILEKLRSKIKEYHEALLLQSQVAQLHRPNKRVLDTLRHWFKKPEPMLGGEAKKYLDDENDLVALKTSIEHDYLSQFLRRHWTINTESTRDGRAKIGRFNERAISITMSAITIAVAAFLLIGSITGFYFVESDVVKLVLIATFTSLFALSLVLITNARRAEIFAATAA
ncbi:hypothetical protein NUW58_g4612 [Xylaria curta]|uniref:Uncharacterized protein n=1 Tax=Xylaria curta TaxID=42375 RepID=A0ACC1P5L7_9PEZI|nr:hypothetical protein NUW58_g4612 [Xylaria curta]